MAPLPVLVEPKSLLASKTLWVNVLTAAAAVLTALSGSELIPATVMPYIVVGLAAVNILLRTITTQPVTLGG